MTDHILSPVKRAQPWPVTYAVMWGPDFLPVTALNSLTRHVRAPNGAYKCRIKLVPSVAGRTAARTAAAEQLTASPVARTGSRITSQQVLWLPAGLFLVFIIVT